MLCALAWAYIALCLLSAACILADLWSGHRHKMPVMNWVWPITALYFGPLAIYWHRKESRDPDRNRPFWQAVFTGSTHCGSGCTIGDFLGEWLVFLGGITIGGSMLWADFLFDFALAYLFGVLFQYFSIAPMRGISGWPGIVAAVKADTVSLVAFEAGMFVFMALTHKVLLPGLHPNEAVYWFMMQLAMIAGFATTFPANWWLIRKGIKERM